MRQPSSTAPHRYWNSPSSVPPPDLATAPAALPRRLALRLAVRWMLRMTPLLLVVVSLSGPLRSVRAQDVTRDSLDVPATTATAPTTNDTNVLPSVTVTADLDAQREEISPSLGANTYTVGRNQIQSAGQGDNSTFQQLQLQIPGVAQEEFGEVHVRGDHGDIQYRVNGISLPENLNGFGQEIDPHIISSFTLIDGTMPAQFGERTAGVFDITTKNGTQLNGNEVSLYGGSYDTIHPSVFVGGSQGKWDYFVTFSYLHNDVGIDNTTSSPDPIHDMTDQEKAFGYFSYRFDETSRLTLLLSTSDSGFQIPNTPGVESNYVLASPSSAIANSTLINDFQFEQNYYAVLSYQKFVGNFSGQISAFSRYADILFTPDQTQELLFDGNAGRIDNNDLANGIQADASYQLGEAHTLRFGLIGQYDIEQLDTTSELFPSSSQFAPSGTGQNLPSSISPQISGTPLRLKDDSGNNGLTFGIYLQDEWKLTPHLTLNYGARYDLFSTSFDHEWQISPRANLVWQIDPDTTLHVGYARYFMPPTLQYVHPSTVREFEYTTNAPFNDQDSPPKAERDHYLDLGISRQITKGWQVTLDSFLKYSTHTLDDGQFGTAVILDNFNYASGTHYGAELSSTYKTGPMSLYGNFSYVQTWVKDVDSVQNEFPTNELSYIAEHPVQMDHQSRLTGSGGVAYNFLTNGRIYSDFLYGNGLRYGFANLGKLDQYTQVNIGVEYVLPIKSKPAGIEKVKLRFDCLNLFDEVYEIRNGTGLGISAAAYGQRRGYYGGVSVIF